MSTFKTVTSSSQVNGNTVETPGQVRKYVAWACAEGCSEIEVMLTRQNYRTDEWGVKHVTVPLPTEAPEVEPSPAAAVAVAVAVEQAATLAAA
jgi:hypothetical protein